MTEIAETDDGLEALEAQLSTLEGQIGDLRREIAGSSGIKRVADGAMVRRLAALDRERVDLAAHVAAFARSIDTP